MIEVYVRLTGNTPALDIIGKALDCTSLALGGASYATITLTELRFSLFGGQFAPLAPFFGFLEQQGGFHG